MIRRMLVLALLLGVPSAFANGVGVASYGAPSAVTTHAGANKAMVRAGARHHLKMLMFTRSAKMPRTGEMGEITF